MLETRQYPWRLFWFLFIAGLLAILAVIPLAIDLFGPAVSQAESPDLPLPLLILIGAVQNLTLLALMVWLGLKLSRRLGLGAPLLEPWLYGEPPGTDVRSRVVAGVWLGIILGSVLLVALLLLVPRLPGLPFVAAAKLALWKRILACFYGGIYEELLMRLFMLSLIAWLLNRTWRRQSGRQLSSRAFWTANVVVALLFGLGHLPSASLTMAITPLVVVVALSFNGLAAMLFGWLYRRHGLEAAIIAHFTADFVLYVIGPSLLRV